MIKYLGSKRRLVPVLGLIAEAAGAKSAVDLFAGTTRVAQEFKRRGVEATAVDIATYSEVLARCYIATDAREVDDRELAEALDHLAALPGAAGYFTETFCVESRYFQSKNGERVDAIRTELDREFRGSPLFPILLTSLMLAADRVDSTTGVQMAYLKNWAPRSYNDLELRVPELIPGSGAAVRGNATELVTSLPPTDLMYLDPPYNQHRYFTNYHVWETLVRWDAPESYGVARKRIDARDPETKSVFNAKRDMPSAFRDLLLAARASTVVVSYNDESWITAEQMLTWLHEAGHQDVRMFEFDSKRYVGAQIGIHNPDGVKVGKVSRLRNVEYLFVAGVREVTGAVARALAEPTRDASAPLGR